MYFQPWKSCSLLEGVQYEAYDARCGDGNRRHDGFVGGGVGETPRKGLVLPVTVTDAQQPNKLTRWAVYVDGDRDDSLSAFVRKKANSADDTIVLDGRQGLYLIVR